MTVIDVAPAMTCSFVTMSPFESISKPEPSASLCCVPPNCPGVLESTVMSTIPGVTSL